MRIHRHRQRKPKFETPVYKFNEQILAPEVRVVGPEGEPLGVLATPDAIAAAQKFELDLVEVSPKAEPPVCKILDYGQFKYQKEKEARKQKAQSKEVDIKGVRLSLNIGEHDLEVRHQQAKKFLERGDKVKAEIRLRGREKAHQDVAREVMMRFLKLIQADFPLRIEQQVTYMNGTLTLIVARA